MKRFILAVLLLFALLLAGCTTVNQTNSFVDLPLNEPAQQTEPTDPGQPMPTVPATTTNVPELTMPPQMTIVPETTNIEPADTQTPAEPTPAPNGLNG